MTRQGTSNLYCCSREVLSRLIFSPKTLVLGPGLTSDKLCILCDYRVVSHSSEWTRFHLLYVHISRLREEGLTGKLKLSV